MLEELEHARKRGASILAEFAGGGMSADAGDIVLPSEAGAARKRCLNALTDARLDRDRHRLHQRTRHTGTPANDPTESKAHSVASSAPHADSIAVSSTKSMHGHALGAAGAIELVAVVGRVA